MTTIQIICTIIVVLATILNLYFVYRNYIEKTPVVDIKVENLPPYSNGTDKTVIIIKNVGTSATTGSFDVLINCSWMHSISYKLNLPKDNYFLAPNEEMTWKIRLDNNVIENSIVSVYIEDKSRSWEKHIQIS